MTNTLIAMEDLDAEVKKTQNDLREWVDYKSIKVNYDDTYGYDYYHIKLDSQLDYLHENLCTHFRQPYWSVREQITYLQQFRSIKDSMTVRQLEMRKNLPEIDIPLPKFDYPKVKSWSE